MKDKILIESIEQRTPKRKKGFTMGNLLLYGSLGLVLPPVATFLGISGYRAQKDALELKINKRLVNNSVYQGLPVEIRDYDNNPRDGCLDSNELEHLLKDFEFRRR
ncbi:MAG: hypothetical protein AABW71_01630 [Nanoarchaeota archaeon]